MALGGHLCIWELAKSSAPLEYNSAGARAAHLRHSRRASLVRGHLGTKVRPRILDAADAALSVSRPMRENRGSRSSPGGLWGKPAYQSNK